MALNRAQRRPHRLAGGGRQDESDLQRQVQWLEGELQRAKAQEGAADPKAAEAERARADAAEAKLKSLEAARPEDPEAANHKAAEVLTGANELAMDIERRARERATEIEESARARAAEIEGPSRARAAAMQSEMEILLSQRKAEAEREAAQIVGDASERSEAVRHELAELLRLREDLVRRMRDVIRDYAQSIGRVERGEMLLPEPALPQMAAPSEPPAEPELEPAAQPGATAAPPSVSAPPAPSAPLVPAAPAPQVQASAGALELDAGPLADFGAVTSFELALGRLASVQDVYVRRYASERAIIDLRVGGEGSILDEMESGLGQPVTVEDSSPGKLRIKLGAQPKQG